MTSVGDLLSGFQKWLKVHRGLAGKQGSGKRRHAIVSTVQAVLAPVPKEQPDLLLDLSALSEFAREKAAAATGESRDHLNFFVDYVDERITTSARTVLSRGPATTANGAPVGGSSKGPSLAESAGDSAEEVSPPSRIIGRVSVSRDTPARPNEFSFWAEDRDDLHLEIGSIVTATGESTEGPISLIGIVTDVSATSATESPTDDFYATGYGDPAVVAPTRRPVIRIGKVSVVRRSDGRFEPPSGNWPVSFATADEIMEAYGADIPEAQRVLAGFTFDAERQPVPIFVDSTYLLGYEGAHLNISGASGLATKTSYALFFLQSILAHCAAHSEPVGVIAFNVKEADLMRIDLGAKTWQEIDAAIGEDEWQRMLWGATREAGVDPLEFREKLRFYAPPRPENVSKPLTFRAADAATSIYSYGLLDLIELGGGGLLGLLDIEDIDEKASALLFSIADAIRDPHDNSFKPRPSTFRDLLNRLRELSRGDEQWVTIGGGTHHTATISKVLNRLNQAVSHQLRGLTLLDDARGHPVPVEKLQPYQAWVVDISKLHPKGQRLIFTNIYQSLYRSLESKRNKEEEIQVAGSRVSLKDFPSRVVVFVDELNKFAPGGRGAAPLKEQIVSITARGRSIGLSLLGAEQIANQVDDELLANSSTFAVGRTHAISLGGSLFQWLQGGLKDRATVLRKGEMIVWHAIHSRPVLVSFPKPIHNF